MWDGTAYTQEFNSQIPSGYSIIITISCYPATVTVTQIVDTWGNNFIATTHTGSTINTPSENWITSIWYAQMPTTENYDSFTVTLSGSATTCKATAVVINSSLSFIPSNSNGVVTYSNIGYTSQTFIISGSQPFQANSLSFYYQGYNYSSTSSPYNCGTYNAPYIPEYTSSSNANFPSNWTGMSAYNFFQSSQNIFATTTGCTTGAIKSTVYQLLVTFGTSGQSIQFSYNFNIGGYTPNFAATATTMTGNTTYGYTVPAFPFSIQTIMNITIWLSSYTSDGYHSNNNVILGIYQAANSGTISSSNPANYVTSKTFIVGTGSTKQELKFTPIITLSNNGPVLITATTQFKGLKVYLGVSTPQEYQDVPDGYNPSALNTLITNSTSISLGGFMNVIFTGGNGATVTSTITQGTSTVYSYATTSTTTVGTVTSIQTQVVTSVIFSLQGAAGGSYIELNLITYFPIWFLPLIFGALGAEFGFGLGGLLYGLMIGLILGQLGGILPLWTVFIDVIMIYVLLRR